jgi:hypothetical protein
VADPIQNPPSGDKPGPEHVLHIERVDEGYVEWCFECVHPEGVDRWRYKNPDGSIVESSSPEECWFESWWSALGQELIMIDQPITSYPVAVRPSDDWDYDNGGTVVLA